MIFKLKFFFNFPVVSKKSYFFFKFVKFDIFITTGKLKKFEPNKSYHFVDLGELILKIYTFFRFQLVFHEIIEENWKIF